MPCRHEISLTTGSAYTLTYQSAQPQPFSPSNPIGGRFDRDAFDLILAQPGCTGIRYYYATDNNGNKCIVVVGTDASNNDMLGLLMELSDPCPNMCSAPNSLNHL
jgi:hypothetical protein